MSSRGANGRDGMEFSRGRVTPQQCLHEDLQKYRLDVLVGHIPTAILSSKKSLELIYSSLGDPSMETVLYSYCEDALDLLNDSTIRVDFNRPIAKSDTSLIMRVLPTHNAQKVLKLPRNRSNIKKILEEVVLLSYISNQRVRNIVPFMGISYIDRSKYSKIRSSEGNDRWPVIIFRNLDLDLHTFSLTQYKYEIAFIRRIWWKLLQQMALCLSDLQQSNVIHGDIKMSNILIDLKDWSFHLCDFSSAKIVISSNRINNNNNETVQITFDNTLDYCSPEIIQNNFYKGSDIDRTLSLFDVDLYSLGLCLLSMITGHEPYEQLMGNAFQSHVEKIPYTVKSQWLMNTILKNNPIALNIFNNDSIYKSWAQEIDVIKRIIIDRISLNELIKHYVNI